MIPFSTADLALARRLEAAEAANGFALAKGSTGTLVDVQEIAGGCALYAGNGSGMTHALGIGMNGKLPDGEFDRLEAFFRDHGSPCLIDLCPMADISVVEQITRRGYRVIEFNNLMLRPACSQPESPNPRPKEPESPYPKSPEPESPNPKRQEPESPDPRPRDPESPDPGPPSHERAGEETPLSSTSPLAPPGEETPLSGASLRLAQAVQQPLAGAPHPDLLTITPVTPDRQKEWCRLIFQGFASSTEVPESELALMETLPYLGGDFFAELDGVPVGGAAMAIHNGVAMLYGDATLPHARGKGIQQALIRHRVQLAAQAGAEWVMACVIPGSGSHRNYERCGFNLFYMRVNLAREW